MALSTTDSRFTYSGDASTVAFSFPRKYIASADLKVVLTDEDDGSEVVQTINTHYTVTGAGLSNGVYSSATVTFVTAPGTDKKVIIYRAPTLTNETDFSSETDALAALNRKIDLLEMQLQRLDDARSRSLRLSEGVYTSMDLTIPDPDASDAVAGMALMLGSGLNSIAWGAVVDTATATVSAAWKTIIESSSLALGLSAAGLGTEDSPTFSGLTVNGRIVQSVLNVAYTLSGNVLGSMQYYNSGSSVTVAASKQLSLLRWEDTLTIGSAGRVEMVSFELTSSASSHATSNLYGVIGATTNAGPGTTKAIYGRATGTGSSVGAIVGLVSGVTPGASTALSVGAQISIDDVARAVDYGVWITEVNGGGAALSYGILIADGVSVSGAGFLMYADGAGSLCKLLSADGLSTLFDVASTGALESASSIKSKSATAGVGYSTGAGGTITQGTSRTTTVQIDKVCGAITLFSAAGSATPASFTVTNSTVAATDVIHVCQKSGTDKYIVLVTAVAAGSFQITFYTTGGTTSEQPVFNFSVLKAVAA